jgi:hypothetical protein
VRDDSTKEAEIPVDLGLLSVACCSLHVQCTSNFNMSTFSASGFCMLKSHFKRTVRLGNERLSLRSSRVNGCLVKSTFLLTDALAFRTSVLRKYQYKFSSKLTLVRTFVCKL